MKLSLYGGFGEKGRTSLGVEAKGFRLIIDVGVNTSATGADVYPVIAPDELKRIEAIIVTHAHEDHIGALGWCLANGFRGSIHMTEETRRDGPAMWAGYGDARAATLADRARIDAFELGQAVNIGPFDIIGGRNGHIAGGIWLHLSDGDETLGYCGDIVPASPVFPMDAMPRADALVIDASYGDDAMSFTARADAIRSWIAAHPGCVLPTPLAGRSLELLAIVDAPLFIADDMREPLRAQIDATQWLRPDMAATLRGKLAGAKEWRIDDPAPNRPLICHDGMGISGPSGDILARARRETWPVLFTGHLPAGSPGALMRAAKEADWLRLPTHPILSENVALVAACAPRLVIGHSAEPDALDALAAHIPAMNADARTGDVIEF